MSSTPLEPHTEWWECPSCLGCSAHCFSCDGTGGRHVRAAECHYCGGPAEVLDLSELDDLKCMDCAWELN